MKFPVLETERLILREILESDAQEILNCFSNEDVLRYYGQNALTDIKQVKRIVKNFARDYNEQTAIKWGVELKGTNSLIGTIGFHNLSFEHKRTDIAYALFPSKWRNGYAIEAVSKVISYGFENLDLTRIGAVVFTENEASIALLTKLRFEKEGVLKNYMYQNGIPYDANVYSLMPNLVKELNMV